MLRRPIMAIAALIALAGCTSAAQEAEQQYNVVERSEVSTKRELCTAASKVRDAYRSAKEQERYELWQLRITSHCSGEEL